LKSATKDRYPYWPFSRKKMSDLTFFRAKTPFLQEMAENKGTTFLFFYYFMLEFYLPLNTA
jgi:hypothetical protein